MSAFYEMVQKGPWLDDDLDMRRRLPEVLDAGDLANSPEMAALVQSRFRSARAAPGIVVPERLEKGADVPNAPHLASVAFEERIIAPSELVWGMPELQGATSDHSIFDDSYARATHYESPYYDGPDVWAWIETQFGEMALFGLRRVYAMDGGTGLIGVRSHRVVSSDPSQSNAPLEEPNVMLPPGLQLGEVYVAPSSDDRIERLIRPVTALVFPQTPRKRTPRQRPPSNGKH